MYQTATNLMRAFVKIVKGVDAKPKSEQKAN
jgi:hypothetical protein